MQQSRQNCCLVSNEAEDLEKLLIMIIVLMMNEVFYCNNNK